MDRAGDHTISLELAQMLRQHALGDAGHLAPEFAEAPFAVTQVEQDQRFPTTADHRERVFDRAISRLLRWRWKRHGIFFGTMDENTAY
jgi:hypothetical protein